MKIIKTSFLPSGVMAMAVYPVILVHKNVTLSEVDLNHEKIHHQQQKEMLLVFFYIWYGIEYLIRWIQCGFDWDKSYYKISFEKEAYLNETDLAYLKSRNVWDFLKFYKK